MQKTLKYTFVKVKVLQKKRVYGSALWILELLELLLFPWKSCRRFVRFRLVSAHFEELVLLWWFPIDWRKRAREHFIKRKQQWRRQKDLLLYLLFIDMFFFLCISLFLTICRDFPCSIWSLLALIVFFWGFF